MRVVLFGATGMLGSGTLVECLAHSDVESVLVVGRRACGVEHEKLREVVHEDMHDFSSVAESLTGYDACFFCLGVSAAGMTEEAYRHVTVGIVEAAARVLLEANPNITFCFISGAGADSSEKGRVMWARVKGAAENLLLEMPFKVVWILRPGYIQPLKGVTSRTRLYNALYTVVGPLYPLLEMMVPKYVTTTERVGRALIRLVQDGADKPLLGNGDINRLAE